MMKEVSGEGEEDDNYTTYPRGHHPVSTVGDVELSVVNSSATRRRSGGGGDHHFVDASTDTNLEADEDDEFHDENSHHDGREDAIAKRQQQQQQHHTIGSARTPWYGTAIILLSEVMGTGILSLPYAAKTLGWVSALVSVPLFAAFSAYSGWLLSQVEQHHHHHHANNNVRLTSYAEASAYLLGSTFGTVTKISMLLNFGTTAIYYLIATADGIRDITGIQCSYQRSFLAALLLVLPCQCRDFHSISKYLSGPSTLAIVLMVLIIIGNLLFNEATTTTRNENDSNTTLSSSSSASVFGDSTNTLWPQEGTTMLQYLEALSAFVFAYQGHSIFLELMSEMKESYKFPMACGIAYIIMCCMYATVVIVAYGLRGSNTTEFLPDILPAGISKQIVGGLVCLHITVSYVIAGQPLHMWLHLIFFPRSYQQESALGIFHWFVVTTGYLLFGYIVGNLIPFFADVQALIGSLFGAPTVFGWPVAFYLVTIGRQQLQQHNSSHLSYDLSSTSSSWFIKLYRSIGCGNLLVCCLFLLVFCPLFCLLGTSAAIASIVRDAEHAAEKPFEC